MTLIARLLTVALAAVFGVAAIGKLGRPDDAARQFADLGVPAPRRAVTLIGAVEVGVAALLVALPPWGAVAAFVVLIGFSAFLAGVIRSGRVVSCACFGGLSQSPVSWRSLVRNLLLMTATLPVMASSGW